MAVGAKLYIKKTQTLGKEFLEMKFQLEMWHIFLSTDCVFKQNKSG